MTSEPDEVMDPRFAEEFPDLAERVSALVEKIAGAFKDVPRPKITRSVAEGFDDEWLTITDDRIEELRAQDPEQVWTDVTEQQLRSYSGYFSFSDDEGWRFYLPAYMSMILRGFPSNEDETSVYFACVNPQPCFDLLNEPQLACVHEFVSLLHESWRRTGQVRS